MDHVPQSIANSAYVTERKLPKYPPQHLRCGLTATSYPKGRKGNIIGPTLHKLFFLCKIFFEDLCQNLEKNLFLERHTASEIAITAFPRTANNGIKTHNGDEQQVLEKAFDNYLILLQLFRPSLFQNLVSQSFLG